MPESKSMKIRIFFSAVLIFFFGALSAPSFVFAQETANGTEAVQPKENQSLFQTIADIQNQKNLLLGLNIDLRQAQEYQFPESEEVDRLAEQLKNLNSELVQMENTDTPEEVIQQKKEEIDQTRFLLEEKSRIFHDSFELHEQKKAQIEADIQSVQDEIEKLRELSVNQAIDLTSRIGFILGFIVLLYMLRFLSAKMIRRFSRHIPMARERVLFRINTIVFNVLIGISIFVAFFSQFISLIPLLAILGTGIAFALRDILSSFIAWFVIGTEQGYKVGDLIETGGLTPFRGRVIEVHPLLTVLRQTGMRGDTGQIINFPNRLIFEQHIRNFSKMFRFMFIMVDYMLEKDSDTEIAKNELEEAIKEEMVKDIDEARKNLPNLQAKFGISEDQIMPQVFVEPDPKGLLLRGKYFCRLDSRHMSRTNITMNFLKRIQKYPNIQLRFVHLGEKMRSDICAFGVLF
jgi:small-conductance mechanosensitive channel